MQAPCIVPNGFLKAFERGQCLYEQSPWSIWHSKETTFADNLQVDLLSNRMSIQAGLFDTQSNRYVQIDPRMGKIQVNYHEEEFFDSKNQQNVIKKQTVNMKKCEIYTMFETTNSEQ